MKRNLFISLFKYRPNDSMTPEENFITESFVYLLQDSLENNRLLFNDFINFIGISEIEDYESISISTQTVFDTGYNKRAIPDILIYINGIHMFIEVKFSSDLNVYPIENDQSSFDINQIDLYQAIKPSSLIKKIFTLTKYSIVKPIKCPDFKRAILWYEVYDLFTRNISIYSNNHLVKDFLQFMEELKMNTPKVSYELSKSVTEIDNLLFQLERTIEELKIPKSNSFGRTAFGYNLFQGKIDDKGQLSRNKDNPSKYYAWIGVKFNKSDEITFQIWDDSVIKYLKTQNNPEFVYSKGSQVYETNEFNFEKEHYFCLSPGDQINLLKVWLSKNMMQLKTLFDQENKK